MAGEGRGLGPGVEEGPSTALRCLASVGNGEGELAGGNRGEQGARAAGGGCGVAGLRLHEQAAKIVAASRTKEPGVEPS